MPWLKYKLVLRPYYDRHGNVLKSIEGRRNRLLKDEFHGGGLVYPDLAGLKVIERYERGQELLVLVDALPVKVARGQAGWTMRRVKGGWWKTVFFVDLSSAVFAGAVLSEEEALATGMIVDPAATI